MKAPYERLESESKQVFEAFVIFRNLGTSRQLKDVSQQLGKNLSLIKRWSTKYNWMERARSYDDHMDKKALIENERLRKQMIKDHAEVSQKLLQKVKEAAAFIKPEKLTPYEIAKLFEVAVKVERLSRGESTDISEISHSGEGLEQSKLSIFERVNQYAELYERMAERKVKASQG